MNSFLIVSAIRNNNDFNSIAKAVGVQENELKSYLISLIENTKSELYQISDATSTETAMTRIAISSYDEYSNDSDAYSDESVDLLKGYIMGEHPAHQEYEPMEIEEDGGIVDVNKGGDVVLTQLLNDSPIKLTIEQVDFIREVAEQKSNVFLTAPGGFGKSASINILTKYLKKKMIPYDDKWIQKQYGKFAVHEIDTSDSAPFALCASTGKAASLLEGARTLHSYLGIGRATGTPSEWARRLTTLRYLSKNLNSLRTVQTIIIDEISMISSSLLDKINTFLQLIRLNEKLFGGIQMVFIGDMAQLPPIETGAYIFKAKAYKKGDFHVHSLTKCFRQTDPAFLNILNEIRYGNCSDESYAILEKQKKIDPQYAEGLAPMRIASTNKEVDAINAFELKNVCRATGADLTAFKIKNLAAYNAKRAAVYRALDSIPDEISVAVGVQIVVTHNITRQVVNGSQGVITSIESNGVNILLHGIGNVFVGYVPYKDPEDSNVFEAKSIFMYMPIKIGYASTVHKIQGMTLKLVDVDLSRVFCHGQAYVAISRCTALDGLIIRGLSESAFICSEDVKRFLNI